ncbi:DUF1190 domain-containing protein [Halomonas sp. V046]|uniref:DUF1190 domain-containing protein n=1 Tax=Halomonas sp. V046 TaxID=3459611 RepID=UPI004044129D
MKRSSSINLARMRKACFTLKPVALGIAVAIAATGCSSERNATVYRSSEDCIDDNPSLAQECEAAYQAALTEAARSGPKYQSMNSCEAEFGSDQCVRMPAQRGAGSWFLPAMGGFLFAKALDNRRYESSALFSSYIPSSPFYNRWTTADGRLQGSRRYGNVGVGRTAFESKPAVTRTISRGGFGSIVSAKSNLGGSRSGSRGGSRGGWGG